MPKLKNVSVFLCLTLVFSQCVEQSQLKVNTVVQHILSDDGLHPYNDNSVMKSFIFQYTQKTLNKLDLESLEYIPL